MKKGYRLQQSFCLSILSFFSFFNCFCIYFSTFIFLFLALFSFSPFSFLLLFLFHFFLEFLCFSLFHFFSNYLRCCISSQFPFSGDLPGSKKTPLSKGTSKLNSHNLSSLWNHFFPFLHSLAPKTDEKMGKSIFYPSFLLFFLSIVKDDSFLQNCETRCSTCELLRK